MLPKGAISQVVVTKDIGYLHHNLGSFSILLLLIITPESAANVQLLDTVTQR